MHHQQFKIHINAPKTKVWEVMLGEPTYREWTSVFAPGSTYVGEWKTGSKMLFVAPDEDGVVSQGMVSTIAECRPYEFISIKHLGIVKDGVEDTESEEVATWAGAREEYTFIEKDGGTEVVVDMDIDEAHKDMFDDMWPRALQTLKVLCEQ